MLKVKNPCTDPAFNLAFEEYFTARAASLGDTLLFFWRNRPSVIVGRFQNSFGEIDQAAAKSLNIDVYRRNSGGGAVYHDLGNLNYSFIIPSASSAYLRGARNSSPFDQLFEAILGPLDALGLKAEKSGRNDLTLDGRKISGAARQLTKHGLLLHGTLLFDADLTALGWVLSADPAKHRSKGLPSVRSRVRNIKEALPGLSVEAFQAALESALQAEEFTPSPADLDAIEDLAEKKYRTWAWNWGNSPPSSLCKKQRFAWGGLELRLDIADGLIKNAAIYGDFFSNAESLPGAEGADPVGALALALCGKQHQSAELAAFLSSLPLEDIFLGAKRADLVAFFTE